MKSLFQTIDDAAENLRREAARVARKRKLKSTITCGELQQVLDSMKASTTQLRKIA